jgi:hypothetical protein
VRNFLCEELLCEELLCEELLCEELLCEELFVRNFCVRNFLSWKLVTRHGKRCFSGLRRTKIFCGKFEAVKDRLHANDFKFRLNVEFSTPHKQPDTTQQL